MYHLNPTGQVYGTVERSSELLILGYLSVFMSALLSSDGAVMFDVSFVGVPISGIILSLCVGYKH